MHRDIVAEYRAEQEARERERQAALAASCARRDEINRARQLLRQAAQTHRVPRWHVEDGSDYIISLVAAVNPNVDELWYGRAVAHAYDCAGSDRNPGNARYYFVRVDGTLLWYSSECAGLRALTPGYTYRARRAYNAALKRHEWQFHVLSLTII